MNSHQQIVTETVDLPVALRDEDLRVLKALVPGSGFLLLTDSQWAEAGKEERAALVRAGTVTNGQFDECLNSNSPQLRAACLEYQEAKDRSRDHEYIAQLETLFDKSRRELINLALEMIPELPINSETSFAELRDALAGVRPEWCVTDDTALEDIWARLEKESEKRPEPDETLPHALAVRPRKALPETVGQSTFHEARNASVSIADGARLRRWKEVPGETALMHVMDGEPLQVKLTAGPSLAGGWRDITYDALRGELQKLDAQSVLLFQILIGLTLEEAHVTLELDHLIRTLGRQPRSRDEREKMRREIFHWLTVFDSLTVHGRRPGKYFDPVTKETLDLTIAGKLIMLSAVAFAERPHESDNLVSPVFVTLTAGPFLEKFRNNKRVLQHFGNVRKLTELPTGKPSGAWALSVGLALNQYWRQGASYSKVNHAGDDSHLTVQSKYPFTRFRLLDLFRSEPWVEDVLNSENPHRARRYWKEAIRLLKQHGVIGYFRELDRLPENRKGWKDYWLNRQRLDIRPKQDGAEAVAELSRSAKKAARARGKKRSPGAARKSQPQPAR